MNPSELRLYAITDCAHLTGPALIEATEALLKGGVTMLQLRDKGRRGEAALLADARALAALCRRYGVPFIVNDDVELALAVDADGVHVGQDDTACRLARARLGPHKRIGVSAHNLAEAQAALADGADYLGCGAVFPSPSKAADVLPLATLKAIVEAVPIPVVAIGGITADNAGALAGSGIAGLAVISALYHAEDWEAAARRLRAMADGLCQV